MKKISVYIFTVLIIIFISIYCFDYELMFVAFFMSTLPILDLIFIKQSVKNMDVNIAVRNVMLKAGEDIPIEAHVNNRGILPVAMIQFDFKCENRLHKLSKDISLRLPVLRWGKQDCIFKVKSLYCGDIDIRLERVRCLDYFGFISSNIKKTFVKKVYVLPNENNLELIKIDNVNAFDVEGKEFSKVKSGDDPSEVFDIREYRPGDKHHSIHWKVSARKFGYMVKEYSLPINSNYSIIMDLVTNKENREKEIDAVIETTMDIVLYLQECGVTHQVIAYDRNSNSVYKEIIDVNDTIVDIMYKLYQSCVYNNRELLYDYELMNEVNDETNVIYVSSEINREKIDLFDSTFKNASKVFMHMVKDDEGTLMEDDEANNVKIIPLNINKITGEIRNIRI